ncbi:MAG TPA: hypothetical protein VNR88_11335 [Hyphomicrobium sp.]|nr:hypothetical protein [Hyphomicrobium sp.]
MRRVFRFSLWATLGILGFLPQFPAEARERLVMPFGCDVEAGEVRLSPGAETSYAIIDHRDEQTVTTCTQARSADCRTVMVHRFTIACAHGAVPWVRVAAAMRGGSANRAWIEDGRLNLVLPARADLEAPARCRNGAGGRSAGVLLSGDCLPWARKASFEHLVLPNGFAPVGELGARLMFNAPVDEAASGLDPHLTQVAMTFGEMTVAKADPDATLEPGPSHRSFDAVLEPDYAANDWITVVHADGDATIASDNSTESNSWALLFALALAAAIAVLAAMRFVPMLRKRFLDAARSKLLRMNTSIANASDAVAAMLQQTETAAQQLKWAGPLRDVLQAELNAVRGRISHIERVVTRGELPPDKAALQFRVLVRELERIRRIVDSALASNSDTKKSGALPRTTSEAYEVLGVNAEVSAGVLKKIVDALRMSWHPDHARDDDDRALREERIRQINIAWDLINGKREAA